MKNYARREAGGASFDLGAAIGEGEAVVRLPGIASPAELKDLFAAGLAACESEVARNGGKPPARGRSRFSVSDPAAFPPEVVMACEDIFLRVLDRVDEAMPSVYERLFRPHSDWVCRQPLSAQGQEPMTPPPAHLGETCPSLRDLYMLGELEWSEGEPAINIYSGGGYFGAHKDHLALTVLIPLTSPTTDFVGGGTGFWAGNRAVDENPDGAPTAVLKPRLGSALIFGGDVTHAGMRVEGGQRGVLVASFSTRTEASLEDRTHGMQRPPTVSPHFKGAL